MGFDMSHVSLKEKYKDYFTIGAGIVAEDMTNPSSGHKDIILKHFNSLTCSNEMKHISFCPRSPDEYLLDDANVILNFAKENNMELRGHTLVWHFQTGEHIFENANKKILLERMKLHMLRMREAFGIYMSKWDVVNEAISDSDDAFLRPSKWLEIIGEDFMDYAFTYAHEVFPETKLFYNDYNEHKPEKSKRIHKAVKSMLDRGIPISGLGLQAHWDIVTTKVDDIKRAFELYASLGIDLDITELDISMYEFHDHTSLKQPTPEMIKAQANLYGEAFKIFREYKDIITNVSTWGVADNGTWLDWFPLEGRKNWPLLFDINNQPKKEVFEKILDF